jgi:Ssp1 endopeptidase immunity protein Rap1a
MRSVLFGTAALALALTAAQAAQAEREEFSASTILPGCKALIDENYTREMVQQGFCMGTIRWVTQMGAAMRYSKSIGGPTLNSLCTGRIPDEVTLAQLVRVVVKYIEARPERMHVEFGSLALDAIREAWPCR